MQTGFFVCAIALAAAVTTAQEKTPKKDDKPVVVVTGCVDGSWLRVQRADHLGSYVERYRLRGSKQMLKEMEKEYKGNLLEVTGAVTDTGNTTHRGKTIDIGKKTRIHTGAKEIPVRPDGTGDPILEVESFRDLKTRCR